MTIQPLQQVEPDDEPAPEPNQEALDALQSLLELVRPLLGVVCPACPHTHSAEETALLVGGVSARTLLNRAWAGEIDSTKTGLQTRFTHDQIAKIIAAGERAARPTQPVRRDRRRRS